MARPETLLACRGVGPVSALPCQGEGTAGAWGRGACEAVDLGGQANKGVWGMSWRRKAMRGVEGCDKPGGAVKRALIPGCPSARPGELKHLSTRRRGKQQRFPE